MGYGNFQATKLSTDITAADATIKLDVLPKDKTGAVITSGRLVIDARKADKREIIKYTGIDLGTVSVTGVTRGQGGITAKPHSKGALVEMNPTAEDWEEALGVPNQLATYANEIAGNFIVKGTGLVTQASGLIGAFSNIIYFISGFRYTKNSIPNKTYTVSKDTYVFIDIAGLVTYTEVANNAAIPSTPANSILVAVVVTNASTITKVIKYNQGVSPVGYSQKRHSNPSGNYATGGFTSLVTVDNVNLKAPIVIRSGKLVRVDIDLSGIWNQNTNYAINIDIGLDGTATKSSSGTLPVSPAGYGNNWTTDGNSRVPWHGTFYFEDVPVGFHEFLLLWATSNASYGGYLGQYAQQVITVTELG